MPAPAPRNANGPAADSVLLLEIRVPAHADRLKLVRAAVQECATFAGLDENAARDVVIAVNEACMNVLQHGYGQDSDEAMTLAITIEPGYLVTTLTDRAPRVDPAQIRSRPIEDVRPGGLGMHFMRECMDEVTFMPPPEGVGNVLRMCKRID